MPIEPTNQEILDRVDTRIDQVLDVLQAYAAHTDKRFDELASDISEQIQGLATHMDERFTQVDQRFDRLEGRMTSVERTMVTKDYLDDKLADLRGDLVLLARKQNRKFESLVEEFVSEGRLSQAAAQRLLALEPFPQ